MAGRGMVQLLRLSDRKTFCCAIAKKMVVSQMFRVSSMLFSLTVKFSYSYKTIQYRVPCKRRSSVNSGTWLRRFDDLTAVKKVALEKQKKEKM